MEVPHNLYILIRMATVKTGYPIRNWPNAPAVGQYVLIKFNNRIGIISHLISEATNRLSRPGGNTYKVICVEPLSDPIRYLDYDVEVYSMKPIDDYTESESFLEYLRINHPRIYEARRKYIVNTRHLVADLFSTARPKESTAPGGLAFAANTLREFLGVQPTKAQISSHYAKRNAEVDAEIAAKMPAYMEAAKKAREAIYAREDAKKASSAAKTESKGGRRKHHRSRKAKSSGRRFSRRTRA
jgi:hypothetical protein